MRVYFRNIFLVALTLSVASRTYSQSEDIVLKAMKDELSRNMEELKLPNFDKPFFIMYGMIDQKNYSVSATLGSLTESTEIPARIKSTVRVLVGDYGFNDESLEDNLVSSGTAIEIQLPVEDDYMGIRRSYWSTTDKVYQDAARHFERHKQTLKDLQKSITDVTHREFAKSDPVKIIKNDSFVPFNKKEWETRVRNLSAVFIKHPIILNSTVSLHYSTSYKYLVNSEGTEVKVPGTIASIMVAAQAKNEKGEFSVEQFFHLATTPDQLPTEQMLSEEIEKLIGSIESQTTLQKLAEEYTGPVLLMGPVVADVFSSSIFRGKETIVANDFIPKLSGFQYNDQNSSMDSKIGKSIYSDLISIKAKPTLKTFNGMTLLGSYEVDDEGIVPPKEVTVVENGILKTLLNNRTITNPAQVANGFSSGPGVLEISVSKPLSENKLKEKLIAKAKEEGLDFAIIIRDSPGFNVGLLKVYKVSVSDGKEELLSNAYVNPNPKYLKKIMGASDKYSAYNLGASGGRSFGLGIGITSFIVPGALLLEEMEIRPFNIPSLSEEEYVSNPLLK